jgi:hypothetical protein
VNIELAKRAVACKHWQWMPGMRVMRDSAWSEPLSQRVPCTVPNGGYPDAWPDLDDPATLGCLLALIRELRHDPTLHAHPYAHGWKWSGNYRCGRAIYDSEAEALMAALEAVP